MDWSMDSMFEHYNLDYGLNCVTECLRSLPIFLKILLETKGLQHSFVHMYSSWQKYFKCARLTVSLIKYVTCLHKAELSLYIVSSDFNNRIIQVLSSNFLSYTFIFAPLDYTL